MRIFRLLSITVAALAASGVSTAAVDIPTPEAHFGFRVGSDRKLIEWADIVGYLRLVGERSPRVNVRELGKTTDGRPFLLLEIASEDTMRDLGRFKKLQQELYFQDHRPGEDPDSVHSAAEREEILSQGKAVVLITCSIHATEVGAAQMSVELVHELATSDSPEVRHILDNVIFLLVPSMNPDGQSMIAKWYDETVGTEHDGAPIPWLYHPYVGHDNNRDMYMYTQAETRLLGEVLYHEWFPSIWLDEHQMGSNGPRIFTMPATDPINLNVHPLVYRLNGFYGQAQAAALEAAGKTGIVYDETYTNFWEGALAWTGWWHNQVGMLTEVASVRIATPTDQRLARLGEAPPGPAPDFREEQRRLMESPNEPLPPPRDVQPRTTYPRPWLGGRWSLRDIVDYELVATHALLETAASTRRRLNEQIYDVNRTTIAQFSRGQSSKGAEPGYGALPEGLAATRDTGRVMEGFFGPVDTPYAIVVPADQHDPPTVTKMLELLERAGIRIERSTAPFEAAGRTYPTGTYVIRLAQVFGRYVKDMLEAQTYPEVRSAPTLPPEPPYDVTAWSLGMQMGVETTFVDEPFEAALELLDRIDPPRGGIEGGGDTYVVSPDYNDGFTLALRMLDLGARVRRATRELEIGGRRREAGSWIFEGAPRDRFERAARELGIVADGASRVPPAGTVAIAKPRIALYQPWGSNMDEGWTRWLLDRFGFDYVTLHPQDLRGGEISAEARASWPPQVSRHALSEPMNGPLARRFDVLLFTHQDGKDILEGQDFKVIPDEYRGGIGDAGLEKVREFIDDGGTVVALGDATGLFIDKWPIPVRNVVAGLSRDEFLVPGSILKIQSDPSHPLAWGMPRDSYGYFIRSPAFALTDAFRSQTATIAVRYPNEEARASGWTRGEERIAGQAAAVEIDFDGGGRLVLLGLRPQHRAQTHATFKLLFNSLMLERARGSGS
jgi:Zinc carboxypeptidase